MGVGHASEGERPFCAQAEGREFIGWPVRRWVCVEGHPLISRKRAVVSSGWRKSRPYEATQSMGKSVIAGFHLLKVRHEVDRSDGIEPNIRNRGWPFGHGLRPTHGLVSTGAGLEHRCPTKSAGRACPHAVRRRMAHRPDSSVHRGLPASGSSALGPAHSPASRPLISTRR
jgi:hypothetical protein